MNCCYRLSSKCNRAWISDISLTVCSADGNAILIDEFHKMIGWMMVRRTIDVELFNIRRNVNRMGIHGIGFAAGIKIVRNV